MGDLFAWIVTIFGLVGFELAGRKIWWAWYVNIANQFAWVAFALITEYYAFLLGTVFYFAVFSKNAYLWTKAHYADKPKKVAEPLPVIGEMLEIQHNSNHGVTATFRLNDEGLEMMRTGKLNGLLIDPFYPGPNITATKE